MSETAVVSHSVIVHKQTEDAHTRPARVILPEARCLETVTQKYTVTHKEAFLAAKKKMEELKSRASLGIQEAGPDAPGRV